MSDDDLVKAEAMTPYQLRAARASLGWSQMQLGLRSNTSEHVVRKFERTGQVARVYGRPDLTDPLATVRATLEAAGVEFTNGEALRGTAAEATLTTPAQVKAARALLGWSITRLSAQSDTSVHAVTIFEQTGRVASLSCAGRTIPSGALAAMRKVLKEAGVEFTGGDIPGVRLRKPAGSE